MRIKHWQGYGTVNARKLASYKTRDGTKTIIEVTGNHEYGIVRKDAYDVHRWLLSRFADDCPDCRGIRGLEVHPDCTGDIEKAIYEITYRPA